MDPISWTLIAVAYLSIGGLLAFAVLALCALGRKPLSLAGVALVRAPASPPLVRRGLAGRGVTPG